MYRTAPRYLLRQVKAPSRSGWQSTRNVSTQPPHMRRRTLKNSLARWGLAGAGIYWYNTSPLFVEDSGCKLGILVCSSPAPDLFVQTQCKTAPKSRMNSSRPSPPSPLPVASSHHTHQTRQPSLQLRLSYRHLRSIPSPPIRALPPPLLLPTVQRHWKKKLLKKVPSTRKRVRSTGIAPV